MTTSIMARFFALLTIIADLFVLSSLAMYLFGRRTPRGRRMILEVRSFFAEYGLWLAGIVAIVSTLGSLYLSEVANFIPCRLCWYQRAVMYPLAVILPVAALRRSARVARYVIPIALLGASISIYHYLLERFPQWSSSASCDPAAPCTVVWIWEFHFISIPFMALSGFAAIVVSLLWSRTSHQKEVTDERRFTRRPAHSSFETS